MKARGVDDNVKWIGGSFLRTHDGRAFAWPSQRMAEVAHFYRYDAKDVAPGPKDFMLVAEALCAFRDIIHMTRENREEWVRLARVAIARERAKVKS